MFDGNLNNYNSEQLNGTVSYMSKIILGLTIFNTREGIKNDETKKSTQCDEDKIETKHDKYSK